MKRLIVLLFALALAGAPSATDEWHIVTVDSGLYIGEYASMALDSSGYPHFSYLDGFNEDLKYAYWDGTAWRIETVDSVGKIARDTSLALDSNGYPHIAYYDWIPDYDLKYASWDGTAWRIETVDSEGDVGRSASLELDYSDHPHISYNEWYGSFPDKLKYAYWDGSAWRVETVDSEGYVGGFTSLALDSSGYPHISYSDYSKIRDCDLKYAYWDGSAWRVETVDYLGYLGMHTSLALDSSEYPHIAYFRINWDFGYLKYASWDGDHWRFLYIDNPSDFLGMGNSLVFDSSDHPHISYVQGNIHSGSLRYTWWDGADWKIETVYSGYCDDQTTLVLDDSDRPHISYMVSDPDNPDDRWILKYAWFGGGLKIADIYTEVNDEGILLFWTVTGNAMAGLRVLRAVSDGEPVEISGLFPGSAVRWLDRDVEVGAENRYWLEVIEEDGTVKRFGPTQPVSIPEQTPQLALGEPYPSPARDMITLTYDLPNGCSDAVIEVYDLAGRRLDSIPLTDSGEITLEVSEYASGVYTARLSTEEGSVSRRLVITR